MRVCVCHISACVWACTPSCDSLSSLITTDSPDVLEQELGLNLPKAKHWEDGCCRVRRLALASLARAVFLFLCARWPCPFLKSCRSWSQIAPSGQCEPIESCCIDPKWTYSIRLFPSEHQVWVKADGALCECHKMNCLAHRKNLAPFNGKRACKSRGAGFKSAHLRCSSDDENSKTSCHINLSHLSTFL